MKDTKMTLAEMRTRVLDALADAIPDASFAVRELPICDLVITVPAADLALAARTLVEEVGVSHLSAITGDDMGDHVRLLYHFWDRIGVTLETLLPPTALQMPTLTTLIPGAAFYEREAFDMFGIVFEGHPNLRPLLLPDDWTGAPPLRRPSGGQGESGS